MERTKGKRGFASMSPEKQREIASKGGKAAHAKGHAHEFDSSEASAAAKKGHVRGTAHEFTSAEAREAGRKGGLARAANRKHAKLTADGQATVAAAPAPALNAHVEPTMANVLNTFAPGVTK